MLKEKERNTGLDLIRAMAISLVLLSHIVLLLFPLTVNTITTSIKALGAIGVDLFFILSGYLIGGILLKKVISDKNSFKELTHFWIRRWLRTLPNYYLILVVNILIFMLLGNILPNNIISYFFFLQNINLLDINFFPESWSLSIEEVAYIILPAILCFITATFKSIYRSKQFITVTVTIYLLFLFFKMNYYNNAIVNSYLDWSRTFRKVIFYRLDSIYLGFILIYFTTMFKTFFDKFNKYLFGLGFILFISLHGCIIWFDLKPETHLFFYVFIYLQLLLLSLSLLFPYLVSINLSKVIVKPIRFISIHAYAIYLINYSIVLVLLRHFIDIENLIWYNKIFIVLFFLIITLTLSRLLYKYFEFPILKYRNKMFPEN